MQVTVRRDGVFDIVDIYVYERLEGGRISICEDLKTQKFRIIEEGVEADPTLKLTGMFAVTFLKAMANAIVEYGIEPDKVKVEKNQLEAVKYHLEDMRKIVFKNI